MLRNLVQTETTNWDTKFIATLIPELIFVDCCKFNLDRKVSLSNARSVFNFTSGLYSPPTCHFSASLGGPLISILLWSSSFHVRLIQIRNCCRDSFLPVKQDVFSETKHAHCCHDRKKEKIQGVGVGSGAPFPTFSLVNDTDSNFWSSLTNQKRLF